jgi:hypothetical protein
MLEQALAAAKEIGDHFREERALWGLAWCAAAREDLDQTEAFLRQSLAVALTLEPENMPVPSLDAALDTLDAQAYRLAVVGEFLAEKRGKRQEACQMFAQAELRYREMATHERIRGLQRRYRRDWQRMRDLQQRYVAVGDMENNI